MQTFLAKIKFIAETENKAFQFVTKSPKSTRQKADFLGKKIIICGDSMKIKKTCD